MAQWAHCVLFMLSQRFRKVWRPAARRSRPSRRQALRRRLPRQLALGCAPFRERGWLLQIRKGVPQEKLNDAVQMGKRRRILGQRSRPKAGGQNSNSAWFMDHAQRRNERLEWELKTKLGAALQFASLVRDVAHVTLWVTHQSVKWKHTLWE